MRNLGILRQLRCNQQLGHFRQWNLLLDLPPLGQIILNLLLDRLLFRGHGQKQNHLRARTAEQLPGARGRGRFLTHEALGQLLRMIFNVAPGLDQILSRNHALDLGNLFFREPRGQEIHDRWSGVRCVPEIDHLLARLHERRQAVRVGFGGSPMRMQDLEPALFFQHFHYEQRIILVRQRGDLVAHRTAQDVFDVFALFGCVVASLRSFLKRPVEAGCKARGANQPRRIL